MNLFDVGNSHFVRHIHGYRKYRLQQTRAEESVPADSNGTVLYMTVNLLI